MEYGYELRVLNRLYSSYELYKMLNSVITAADGKITKKLKRVHHHCRSLVRSRINSQFDNWRTHKIPSRAVAYIYIC